jgi:2-desacetyl-2-hydroxyethyl bacteriochlorophyllide A dehydrogenase
MKAIVFRGPEQVKYSDFADPVLEHDHEVILAVTKSSICGSDLHMYHGGTIATTDYSTHVEPFCLGHEFIGKVAEKGKAVESFANGDMVIAAGSVGCAVCQTCREGRPMLCEQSVGRAYGTSAALHGGQAQFVKVPNADANLVSIPAGISDEMAVLLTDQLPTAYMGAKNADIQPGDDVGIIGLGSVGLLAVECAFLLGAARVFGIDLVPERREAAKGIGATVIEDENPKKAIMRLTGGKGLNRVIVAAGSEQTVQLSLRLAAPRGNVSVVGLPSLSTRIPVSSILYKNLTLRMAICSAQEQWKELIPLVKAGRIQGTYVFTHEMNLSEGQQAYRVFDAREDGCIKIMLKT